MILGIVGSRNFEDFKRMSQVLDQFKDVEGIVSGGASGADTLAVRYAEDRGLTFQVFPANWKKYGRAAGPIRNKLIVKASDRIVAFLEKGSTGTQSTIRIARGQGKPVYIIRI